MNKKLIAATLLTASAAECLPNGNEMTNLYQIVCYS